MKNVDVKSNTDLFGEDVLLEEEYKKQIEFEPN